MSDIVPTDPRSTSEALTGPDSAALVPYEEGVSVDAIGDEVGLERHVGRCTGFVADEPANYPGTINAAVNQLSQTILVNVSPFISSPSDPSSRACVDRSANQTPPRG